MTEDEVLKRIKSRFAKRLIEIVGKGNLLEALIIRSGSFQNAVSLQKDCVDSRNHQLLSQVLDGKKLGRCFNKQSSLQGLFLIFQEAYMLLSQGDTRSTEGVINNVYEIIKKSQLGEQLKKIMDDHDKLKLLNILANPEGTPPFATEEDFQSKVLARIKDFLNKEGTILNEHDHDKVFALTKCVIECYYSIHKDVKIDKGLALLLSTTTVHYDKLSPSNQVIEEKIFEISNNELIYRYIEVLTYQFLHKSTATMIDCLGYGFTTLYPMNIEDISNRLLENQDNNEFEERVTNPENIAHQYYKGKNSKDNIFHLAVLNGDIEVIDDLVKSGTDVNIQGSYGPPLLLAVELSNINMVNALIERGADVNIQGSYESPLLLAVKLSNTNMVNALIERGADVNKKEKNGRTPLYIAARYDHGDIVKTLLGKGADVDAANIRYTSLHVAVIMNKIEEVRTLIAEGGNPLAKDIFGKIPRDLAEDKDMKLLLKVAETKYITNKAIKSGVTLGIIAGLTVGVSCSIASVESSIAVAAALAVGLVAGGIAYAVLKPSDKLDKPDLEVANQQVNAKVC